MLGSLSLLILSGIHDVDKIFHHVEWGTLLFFTFLFILMRGLDELGLVQAIGETTATIISLIGNPSLRLLVGLIVMIWVSALVSAFIDNIPYTTAMIPVVITISKNSDLPLKPLVWALAFGTCLGGNGTLIGASANVVCAGLSQQAGYPISFNRFFKSGFPLMLITIFVAMLYLLFIHSVLHLDL